MSVSIDITDQSVYTALRAFLLSYLPSGTEVVQGQDNLVSMPLGGFAVMTCVGQVRVATNADTYPATSDPVTKSIGASIRFEIQVDFYGPNASVWASEGQTLFRDAYATDQMPSNIQPLYMDDPVQMPLIDAEQQYEDRWRVKSCLHYKPILTVDQQFASSLTLDLVEIDATFHP